MVMYSAKAEFYRDSMLLMNNLRQNGSFCDITLTVGNGQVQAHRCVLAASSQYFHSLFLGQFMEASMPNVSLSEVTKDVDALELVIDFMYSGKIDINIKNLGVILKLSTFFLIDPLREFCLEYMKSHLDLQTCLRFFLYAVEHNLNDIEHDAKLIVTSRFHDFIILEDKTDLSPDEMLFLFSNKICEHCSTDSILQYLAKWVIKGMTEEHVSVASQILDQVHARNISPLQCNISSNSKKAQCSDILDKLKVFVLEKEIPGVEKLLKKWQQIVIKLFSKLDAKRKTYNLRLSLTPKQLSCSEDMENAVFTLSPRQCVIDVLDQAKRTRFPSDVTYNEPVFTLCLYAPRTKVWYYVQDFKAEGVMGDVLEEMCFGASLFMFTMYKGELVVMFCSEEIHFYNLRQNSWRTLYLTDLVDSDLADNEFSGSFDHCYVTGNNTIYLILKVKIYEDTDFDEPVGEYFKGYKLDENGQVWENIFKTDTERNHACAMSELQAKISSASNELIFTHGPCCLESGYSYVYIVNLNESTAAPVTVSKVFVCSTESEALSGIRILETRNKFYIVKVDPFGSVARSEIIPKYEYKFNSLTLTRVKDQSGNAIAVQKLRQSKEDTAPCSLELTIGAGNSLWSFEGNGKSVSFMYEVSVTRNRGLTSMEHTPPPFSCMSAMFAAEVPTDLVDQLSPVSRFMLSDKESH